VYHIIRDESQLISEIEYDYLVLGFLHKFIDESRAGARSYRKSLEQKIGKALPL